MFDLTITPDRPYKYATRPSEHILRVRLTPQHSQNTGLPLHLAIALDTSSSMNGEKLAQAKIACQQVLSQLRPNDHFSLASYATQISEISHYIQPGGRDTASEISILRAGGVTRMDLALQWLEQVLDNNHNNNQTCIGILITDGNATNSDGKILTDTSPLIQSTQQLSSKGIILYTVGLGSAENFNTAFLLDLSKGGNGNFLYAEDPKGLSTELQERLHSGQSIMLQTAQLQLSPLNGATIEGFCQLCPDYQPLEETVPNHIFLHGLQGSQPTDILIRLQVPPITIDSQPQAKSVLGITLLAENQAIAQSQISIQLTHSYRESQNLDKEIARDYTKWQMNSDSEALFHTEDLNKTGILLQRIEANALKTGQDLIAQQAAAEYQNLLSTGKLNPERTTGILNQARKLNKSHE